MPLSALCWSLNTLSLPKYCISCIFVPSRTPLPFSSTQEASASPPAAAPLQRPRPPSCTRRAVQPLQTSRQPKEASHTEWRSHTHRKHIVSFVWLATKLHLSPAYANIPSHPTTYITTPEFEAIRCDSLAYRVQHTIGKLTYRPQLRRLLRHRASNGRTLHLSFRIYDLRPHHQQSTAVQI